MVKAQKRVEAAQYGFEGNVWVSISINIPAEYHFSDIYNGGILTNLQVISQ